MSRYFLPIGSMNKINLCMANIKIYFNPLFVSHFDYLNTLRSVLFVDQLAIGQLTTLIKCVKI